MKFTVADPFAHLRIEENDGDRLNDGTHIIYVNGATRSATEIGRLVHDLLCPAWRSWKLHLLGAEIPRKRSVGVQRDIYVVPNVAA